MTSDDVRACFGCHATGAIRDARVDLDKLVPGLQCEGCHGPGASHVEAVEKTQFNDLKIRSLKNMVAEEQSDFCGSCHRTWSQVMLMGLQGPANVRFQPYRIANSRCYNTDDEHIRCTACHDPHRDPLADAGSYDAKCLACHALSSGVAPPSAVASTNAAPFPSATPSTKVARSTKAAAAANNAPACPIGKEKCSQCHMPRIAIPGAHFEFTDHQIRIHRPGDPYPN